ncbi:MAG TPA: hypothetical protein VKC66_14220 [Xanthobacteraceae bacterium]|nr:hypothetical protein [Xanthobacteraceae bacterium]
MRFFSTERPAYDDTVRTLHNPEVLKRGFCVFNVARDGGRGEAFDDLMRKYGKHPVGER